MLTCHIFWHNSVNLTKETATDWRHGWPSFILLLVSLWSYMRSEYRLAKAKNLLLLSAPLFLVTCEVSVACFGREQVASLSLPCAYWILFYFTRMYLLCVCECICIWVDVCTHAHVCICVETWGQPQVFSPTWFFWDNLSSYLELAD